MIDSGEAGGTIVGVAASGGVVLAADRRVAEASVRTGTTRRIEDVHPTAAAGGIGPVGDVGPLLRALRSGVDLYGERRGAPPGMDALATMASDRVREGSGVSTLVVGGVDDDGPALYRIDADGGRSEGESVAAGSGMEVAAGALEASEGAESMKGALRTAAGALSAATGRDPRSGDGTTVAEVTAEGVDLWDVDSPEELL